MLKQIKVLGIALVLGLGLNMVGCESTEDTNIDNQQKQKFEEAAENMTDEEKYESLVNISREFTIQRMEEEGLDVIPMQLAYHLLDIADNSDDINYFGLDKHQGRLATAEGILQAGQLCELDMNAEELVAMFEDMKDLGMVSTDEYLYGNGLDEQPMTYEEFAQCVNIAGIEIFGNNASQFQAKIIDFEYDKDDEIKVIFEYMATGRNVCYIMMNKYTGEYTVHDANVLQQILESLR